MAKIQKTKGWRVIVWLTIFTLLLGMTRFSPPAEASPLTKLKDTISDSDLGVVANHEIYFQTPSGTATGTTITLTFQSGFSIPGALNYTDIDMWEAGTELTLAATAGPDNWRVSTSTNQIILTAPASSTSAQLLDANSTTTIKIGTNASGGDQQITNPSSAGSYSITIGGTFGDSGTAMVAIIEDVTVTATVSATLVFTISGVASSTAIKNATTTASTTATTIPFGTLEVGTSSIAAQTLSVSTNASDGFTVTVFQDQNLTSAGGSDIDCFDDGVCATTTASYAAWSSPAGTLGQENTYGHFGFTSEDNTLGTNCGSDDFGTNKWGGLLGTTQDEVMCHTGPADGTTEDKGQVKVGFQVQISALQEAGDYTNTLTYIATPTY